MNLDGARVMNGFPAPPMPTSAAGAGATGALVRLLADPRLAIQEDGIVCLICGETFRQLTNTHLRAHGTTATAYKIRFGYNRRRPLMCEALRRRYVERAVRVGLAGRIAHRPILAEPALRRRGGLRPVTLEEALNRRDAQRRARSGVGPRFPGLPFDSTARISICRSTPGIPARSGPTSAAVS